MSELLPVLVGLAVLLSALAWAALRAHRRGRVINALPPADNPRLICDCGRPAISSRTRVVIRGETFTFTQSRLCKTCTQQYMEEFSTTCGSCGETILVGDPVGAAPDDAPFPYTHLCSDCSPFPGLFCGHWGEGKLVPLSKEKP